MDSSLSSGDTSVCLGPQSETGSHCDPLNAYNNLPLFIIRNAAEALEALPEDLRCVRRTKHIQISIGVRIEKTPSATYLYTQDAEGYHADPYVPEGTGSLSGTTF